MSEKNKCPKCGSDRVPPGKGGTIWTCGSVHNDGDPEILCWQSDECHIRELEQQLATSRRWLDPHEVVEPGLYIFQQIDENGYDIDDPYAKTLDAEDVERLHNPQLNYRGRFFRLPVNEREDGA